MLSCLTTGRNVGSTMTTAGRPSSTAPIRMKRTAVITRKPACPASTAAIAWASDAGTCYHQDPRDDGRRGQEEADVGSHHGALDQDLRQLRPANLPIYEQPDDRRVEDGDGRRLRRRHHAAQDAAEDDDRECERDQRAPERPPEPHRC